MGSFAGLRLEELLRQPTEQIVVTDGFLQIPGHIHLKGEGADEGAIAGMVLVLEHPHAMLALTSVPSSEDQVSVVDAEMVHQGVLQSPIPTSGQTSWLICTTSLPYFGQVAIASAGAPTD